MGKLATLVLLVKLKTSLQEFFFFPLLVWIVVVTPWFLDNSFILLYDILRRLFKSFLKKPFTMEIAFS